MNKLITYVIGLAGVTAATAVLQTVGEDRLDLDSKPALPRVLLTVVLGGIVFAAVQEYKRAYRPSEIDANKWLSKFV